MIILFDKSKAFKLSLEPVFIFEAIISVIGHFSVIAFTSIKKLSEQSDSNTVFAFYISFDPS